METQHKRVLKPTVRGLAARLKSVDRTVTDATDNEACHVYSRRVEEVFKSMPLMSVAHSSSSTLTPGCLC